MKLSKRSPLLNNSEINSVVGSLGEEMERQDLDVIDGGSFAAAIAAAAVTAVVAANNIYTQVAGCGYVYTASAECSSDGEAC